MPKKDKFTGLTEEELIAKAKAALAEGRSESVLGNIWKASGVPARGLRGLIATALKGGEGHIRQMLGQQDLRTTAGEALLAGGRAVSPEFRLKGPQDFIAEMGSSFLDPRFMAIGPAVSGAVKGVKASAGPAAGLAASIGRRLMKRSPAAIAKVKKAGKIYRKAKLSDAMREKTLIDMQHFARLTKDLLAQGKKDLQFLKDGGYEIYKQTKHIEFLETRLSEQLRRALDMDDLLGASRALKDTYQQLVELARVSGLGGKIAKKVVDPFRKLPDPGFIWSQGGIRKHLQKVLPLKHLGKGKGRAEFIGMQEMLDEPAVGLWNVFDVPGLRSGTTVAEDTIINLVRRNLQKEMGPLAEKAAKGIINMAKRGEVGAKRFIQGLFLGGRVGSNLERGN